MGNKVYRRFSAEEVADKEMDLGMAEDIREQLIEGRRSIGFFNEKEYIFESFDSGGHKELVDKMLEKFDGPRYFLSSFYQPNRSDMGISITHVGGNHIISDFERRVMYRLLKEVKDSECIIPEGIDSCYSGLESQIKNNFERESERLLREKEKQEMAEKAATEEKRRRDKTFKGKILNMLGR